MGKYQNKEWLQQQFSVPGTRIQDIATRAGCNEKTIRRWQKRLGVESRPIAENAWLRQANHKLISKRAHEIIEGHLLGDGNLHARSNWSARYQHTSSSFDNIKWIANDLKQNGLLCGNIHKNRNIFGNWVYCLHTHTYTHLKKIHDKWYPYEEKIIPLNLCLTPIMGLMWYLGDGGLTDYSHSYKPLVRIATDGFYVSYVEFLASQLTEFIPRIQKCSAKNKKGYGYRIIMELNFLDWIGPCPKELQGVYGHKWRKSLT